MLPPVHLFAFELCIHVVGDPDCERSADYSSECGAGRRLCSAGRGGDTSADTGTVALGGVADPGCLSRIRIFSIMDLGSHIHQIRIRNKEFNYFHTKNCF
jgi:hypothetical protein